MTSATSGLPAEARELYGLPLDEFTARRNALAKELKGKGDTEVAAMVAGLKKPKQSAWVLNRMAREETDAVGELLEVADRLSEGGSRSAIRAASDRRHEVVRHLMKRAEAILSEGGRKPSATTLEEVRRTLYAAVDDDDRELLRTGTLTEPIEASGFGTEWSLGEETEAEPEPEPSAADRKRQRQLEKLESALREAEQAANAAAAATDRARRGLADAEAEEAKARAKVDRLREKIAGL